MGALQIGVETCVFADLGHGGDDGAADTAAILSVAGDDFAIWDIEFRYDGR